ncbi:MAG: molybdopterin-dependent oxidoreductase, partial [Adlercreutzia equolifaciens]
MAAQLAFQKEVVEAADEVVHEVGQGAAVDFEGDAVHGELRGKDEWERISWDEALTLVTDELKRVYAEYGQDAVVCNGWRWAPGSAMFPVIGGAVYNTECESFGCWGFQ